MLHADLLAAGGEALGRGPAALSAVACDEEGVALGADGAFALRRVLSGLLVVSLVEFPAAFAPELEETFFEPEDVLGVV